MPSPLSVLLSANRSRVMGILNATPDSFSDGGRYLNPTAALDHALSMQNDGADLIDVGAESTRPGAPAISEEEELGRLLPVLDLLISRITLPLSVDTSKEAVMREALKRGVRIINNVHATRMTPAVLGLLAEHQAGLILMHSRGTPTDMQDNTRYSDITGEVITGLREARDRAAAAGIPSSNILVDPGIGFGKSVEGNWELLRALPRIKAELGQEILIGISQKSFLSKTFGVTGPDLAVPMAAVHLAALMSGARFLRVHDIIGAKQTIQAFEIWQGKPCN